MDPHLAARMASELKGQGLAGWTLVEKVGEGKSALVFRAERNGELAAVKIFDPDMVERLGKDKQRLRVRRERDLVGMTHPHLIKILDAGEDTDRDLFFVIMEFFDGPNLDAVRDRLPVDRVQPLLAQVAAAAEFLESREFAHRDIKPENIGVSRDYSTAVLLDLGVIRPIGLGSITDNEHQKAFLGTLQYSPPELLFREEQDDLEGWRAVSFYQLGAVLHDLITRRRLFDGISPYARLVEAVRNEQPTLVPLPEVSPDLVLLAENCLIKSPEARLKLVSWNSFRVAARPHNSLEAARERIAKRVQAAPVLATPTVVVSKRGVLEDVSNIILLSIRGACHGSSGFPPHVTDAHEVADDHVCTRSGFARSLSHAVANPYVVFLETSCIDAESCAARIMIGVAFIDDAAACVRQYENRKMTALYQGVVRAESLRVAVEKAMTFILDAAQSGQTPNGWLDLNGVIDV